MTTRTLVATIVVLVLVGLTLMGSSPLSGSWTNELTFKPNGTFAQFLRSMESLLTVDYTISGLAATSTS